MPSGIYIRTKEICKSLSRAKTREKHPLWGKHHTPETKLKMSLSNPKFWLGKKQSKATIEKKVNSRRGYTHTKETIDKIRKSNEGENGGHWKGDSVGYWGIHKWLIKNYGKATKCSSAKCRKNSIHYEWALIKGKKYERKKENFIELCKSCHSIYDGKAVVKFIKQLK
jgi:hypothetical protein